MSFNPEQFTNELVNEYGYADNMRQYDFNHVQHGPPHRAKARPVTSNRGAGYSATAIFDPLNQVGTEGKIKTESLLSKKAEDKAPEEKLRDLEKEIHGLVEESAVVREQGDLSQALELAKEAGKRERTLCRQREQQGLLEQLNVDLTYAVCLNLAISQHANNNDTEAISIYNQIVRNKQYPHSGRFRVNMGNIYFAQGKYPSAIKMYRMALDQIPNNVQSIRLKISRNIGHAFFKMHQFPDAIDAYETLLYPKGQYLDFMTGFHLILCYHALGDREKMKQGFLKLLQIQPVGHQDEDHLHGEEGDADAQMDEEPDALRQDIKKRQRDAQRYIVNAATLIAPQLEPQDVVSGFDYVIDALNSHGFPGIASEMEIGKATHYLKRKDFDTAISTLRNFEKKEPSLMARASTNLSFLYFLEGDYGSAERYADIAVKADRYNSRALVNKGNCLFVAGDLERAKEVYLEAIGVSADCLEAIYNLGLVNSHLGKLQEALLAFDKLHSITHNNMEVMWQLGDIHERLGNLPKAHEWLSLIVTSQKGRPSDPGVLARLASIFNKMEDETQAFHYNLESYRFLPSDMTVITWLGIYYVKQELYEMAIQYFARAAQIQPNEIKWLLMVASCYRRMGSYHPALKLYEEIHRTHPNDKECLRYLITICKEMKQPYEKYQNHLRKLEKFEMEQSSFADNSPTDTRSVIGAGEDFGAARVDTSGLTTTGVATGAGGGVGAHQPSASGSLFEVDEVQPQADRRSKRKLGSAGVGAGEEDLEDWGDDDLGDDLLPM
eukprot:CAMPEP_0179008480 /NCGR_PEP_ID=MMETSP0795-20121207/15737_1 /TAXON_ID=88552 /ORGANISM="Amoebophrya sp., Strain Ameob2" /LENGTH=778 /DNA_ID=CAMNT_0020703565 /DNA_START=412 /DNA_END=2749 /DNA_ORIENTATION=+